jgi:hypothetical protein
LTPPCVCALADAHTRRNTQARTCTQTQIHNTHRCVHAHTHQRTPTTSNTHHRTQHAEHTRMYTHTAGLTQPSTSDRRKKGRQLPQNTAPPPRPAPPHHHAPHRWLEVGALGTYAQRVCGISVSNSNLHPLRPSKLPTNHTTLDSTGRNYCPCCNTISSLCASPINVVWVWVPEMGVVCVGVGVERGFGGVWFCLCVMRAQLGPTMHMMSGRGAV